MHIKSQHNRVCYNVAGALHYIMLIILFWRWLILWLVRSIDTCTSILAIYLLANRKKLFRVHVNTPMIKEQYKLSYIE